MLIIPVIDLIGGQVVRAQRGERASYRPIQSQLADGCAPADIVAGFLGFSQFTSIYIADLDAIMGKGNNDCVILALESRFPTLRFWVDAAVSTLQEAENWLANHASHLVLGSECLRDADVLMTLKHNPRVILSLDFRGDILQGLPNLDARPELWPQNVIAMTLARVGSHSGPDFSRIHKLLQAATTQKIIAAGGARNIRDAHALKEAGVSGLLAASALHDGGFAKADITDGRV